MSCSPNPCGHPEYVRHIALELFALGNRCRDDCCSGEGRSEPVPPPNAHQVMRDYYAAPTMALETGGAEEKAEAKRSWRKRARQWLSRALQNDAETKEPPRKKHRVKAYQWLVALDAAITRSTSVPGLSHFLVPQGGGRPPFATWPQLAIVPDRGSDGVAALQYLLYNSDKRANIVHIPDPNRDCWNDVRSAAKDVGLATFIVAKTITLNYRHGPWQDSRFFIAGQEAVAEYIAVASPACPLFSHYLPHLAKEYELDHRLGEDGVEDLVWDRFRQARCWQAMGELGAGGRAHAPSANLTGLPSMSKATVPWAARFKPDGARALIPLCACNPVQRPTSC